MPPVRCAAGAATCPAEPGGGAARRAHARLTFFMANGSTVTSLVSVPGATRTDVAVSHLARINGTFGLSISADRVIAAQVNLTRDGRDGDAIPGSTGLDTRWYLA